MLCNTTSKINLNCQFPIDTKDRNKKGKKKKKKMKIDNTKFENENRCQHSGKVERKILQRWTTGTNVRKLKRISPTLFLKCKWLMNIFIVTDWSKLYLEFFKAVSGFALIVQRTSVLFRYSRFFLVG
jgi:hypothetical protein